MKMSMRRKSKGQAIVEYIIIVVVVAIAALTIIGMFSDTIREKIAGATASLGSKEDVSSAVDKKSSTVLKDLDREGVDLGSDSK